MAIENWNSEFSDQKCWCSIVKCKRLPEGKSEIWIESHVGLSSLLRTDGKSQAIPQKSIKQIPKTTQKGHMDTLHDPSLLKNVT